MPAFDFSGSGFDRGHMVPNADRDKETSIPINQATFLMTNMVPQAPDNNQGPWAAFENYLRTLLPADESTSSPAAPAWAAPAATAASRRVADGNVTVPAQTWKVALVLPEGRRRRLSRVSCSTRTIAVIMPNTQGIRNDPWENLPHHGRCGRGPDRLRPLRQSARADTSGASRPAPTAPTRRW